MSSKDDPSSSKPTKTYLRDTPRPVPNATTKPDGYGSSVANAERKVLSSWKEIAAYLGRGVRTLQRYEAIYGLPVRRVAGRDRSAVMALTDELNEWLNRSAMKERRYVRPTLVVIDRAVPGTISSRKLVLEVARFNVLTAYSAEEAYSTAQKFDVDGFVLDYVSTDEIATEVCESLKERYPKKPIFAVAPLTIDGEAKGCADHVVAGNDPQLLLTAVLAVFGTPRLE